MTINDKIQRVNNLIKFNHAIWKNSSTIGPSVTHEERKAHVQSALVHQAPPSQCDCCQSDKVLNIPDKHFIEEELNTLEKWVDEAEPWSDDHIHIISLISIIMNSTDLPHQYRTRAIALIKRSINVRLLAVVYK